MIYKKSSAAMALIFAIALALASVSFYYLGPSITGFVTNQFTYQKNLNLVVTASTQYNWQLDNFGELKSLKLYGKVTDYGKARVYIESAGTRHLIFDSTMLNESIANQSKNFITGFAVKEENIQSNSNKSDKAKKNKNRIPEWNGPNQFIINGTARINLSEYFSDKDQDSLIYSVSDAEGIEAMTSDELVTLKPLAEKNMNTTITFTASDGIDSKSQVVELIITVEKAAVAVNKAPVWNSNIDSFMIEGVTTINLSKYFSDEDNDNLVYGSSLGKNITININNEIATLIPDEGYHGNASVLFSAYDGKNLTTKSVGLIVPETAQNVSDQINETNKSIRINFAYNPGTIYDANDNGEESVNGVVDLTLNGTSFSWNVDESKLCTRYEVYNEDKASSTIFCNGNKDCCAFVDLLPTKNNWSEIYYSTSNKDGAGYSNIVSAQVIYYDVNLTLKNPKSEIYYSEWGNKNVKFYNEETEFQGVCVETCNLTGFNKTSYNLIFEIEGNAVLRIDKIEYDISANINYNAPVLLQNFTSINISKNSNATINLSQYFYDGDGDNLAYGYYKVGNATIYFENNTAIIVPDKDFVGALYTYITANDSINFVASDVFAINVVEKGFVSKSNKKVSGRFRDEDIKDKSNGVVFDTPEGDYLELKVFPSLNVPLSHGHEFSKNKLLLESSFNVTNNGIANQLKSKQMNVAYQLNFSHGISNEYYLDKINLKGNAFFYKKEFYCIVQTGNSQYNVKGNVANQQLLEGGEGLIINVSYQMPSDIEKDSTISCYDPVQPNTDYVDGSAALIADSTVLASLSADIPAGTNMIFATANINVSSSTTQSTNFNITRNGAFLTGSAGGAAISTDTIADTEFWAAVYLDTNAPASPTYVLNANSTLGNAVKGEAKMVVINGVTGYYNQTSAILLSSTVPTTLALARTTLPAGNHTIIAIAEFNDSVASGRTIAAGNLQLRNISGSTFSVLSQNEYAIELGVFGGGDTGKVAVLTFQDTNAPANAVYNVTALASTTNQVFGKASLLVLDSTNFSVFYANTSINSVSTVNSNITNVTQDFSPSRTSLSTSDVVVIGSEQSVTASSIKRMPVAGLNIRQNDESSVNMTSNDFQLEVEAAQSGVYNGLVRRYTNVTAINANYSLNANMSASGVSMAGRLLAIRIPNPSSDINPPDKVNTSVNISSPTTSQVINFTGNATDDRGIVSMNITYNISGIITNINFSFNGNPYPTLQQVSNVTTLPSTAAVINFTMYATDIGNNVVQNSTLVSVIFVGDAFPTLTLGFNLSTIQQNNQINFSANATDDVDIATLNLSFNYSGVYTQINFTAGGASDFSFNASNNSQVTNSAGGVINYTAYVTDSIGQVTQKSQLFTIIETNMPVVNTTFNITNPVLNDVINFTGNITDNVGLLYANITWNISGIITYSNYTITGTSAQVSNSTQVCSSACVINFTMYATDTSNNVKQNSTLITVTDNVAPIVNVTLNKSLSFIELNNTINITANITDDTQLLSANITYNMSGILTKVNFTLSGTTANISNATQINCDNCVINFTVYATDTSNNVRQNSTLITVTPQIEISNCTNLTLPNRVYVLVANASSATTCFNIFANNITLDCHGFKINYSQVGVGYGINNSGYNYSTVRSCNIVQDGPPSTSNSFGIYIQNSANSNISNNSVIMTGLSAGIAFGAINLAYGSNNNTVSNNIITATGLSSDGIDLIQTTYNNSVYGNSIKVTNSNSAGIFLYTNSYNNDIYNNNITNTKNNGILFDMAYNNKIHNNNITTTFANGYAVFLYTSSSTTYNNSIFNNTITTSGDTGVGIYSYQSSSFNHSFYNNIIITTGPNSEGIHMINSQGNTIFNNNITTYGSSSDALVIADNNDSVYNNIIVALNLDSDGIGINSGAHNNIVYNNIINITGGTSTGTGHGIVLQSTAYNNSVYGNNITTSNLTSYGIFLNSDVFNNTIYNNNITTKNLSGSYGIYLLRKVNNNTFYRNTISSLAAAIVINGSTPTASERMNHSLNTFTNDTIIPCSTGCAANYQDIILTSNVTDITFTNVSFNKSRVAFVQLSPDNGPVGKNNMTVNWFLDVNVTNSSNNNPIANAQVVINDTNGLNIFNGTTDATGGIPTQLVIEYTQNGTVPWGNNESCRNVTNLLTTENLSCFTTYNISVNITGYNNYNTKIDVNRSKFLNISINLNGTLASCGNLNSPNTVYNLINDVSSGATCFNIMANNITLDCHGFEINYSQVDVGDGSNQGYGVNNTGFNYSVIKSCYIAQADLVATNDFSHGIYLESNSSGNEIFNNTIYTSGYSSDGVYGFNQVFNNSIHNNNITIMDYPTLSSSAIWLSTIVYNNTIYDNNIMTPNSIEVGIELLFGGYSNSIHNNNITLYAGTGINLLVNDSLAYNNNIISQDSGIVVSNYNNSVYGNNITLNGSGAGISITSSFSNIYNNNITTRVNRINRGISLLSGANFNNVYGNKIITTGLSGTGINLSITSGSKNVNNNLIYGNNISTSSGYGISLGGNSLNSYVYNNSIFNNTITTTNISGHGIFLYDKAFNNTFYNNNITTKNLTGTYGIYIGRDAKNNTFYKNTISSLSAAIVINGSTNTASLWLGDSFNTFTNDTIIPCSIGCDANYKDIILTANVTDITFTNVSFNKSRVAFVPLSANTPTEKNNMTVNWFLDVNVTNSSNNNPIANAQVVINDTNGLNIFNGTTDSTGGIPTQIVTSFTMNGSVPWGQNDSCVQVLNTLTTENLTCFNTYNISVNITGYNNYNTKIDVNRSKFLNLSLAISAGGDAFPTLTLGFNLSTIQQNNQINFSANATDDVDIATLNLSFNYSGIYTQINFTAGGASDFSFNASNNSQVIDAAGGVINYTAYVTDSSNQVTQKSQLFTISTANTCSCPASGDWVGSFADDCVITSDCNLQGNSLYLSGSGTWTINALIYNFNKIVAHQGTLVCIKQTGCFG